ncbi:hypothetical protein VTL71DRAFT_6345 [Oculimacula yallundae]|uniref:Rhodopsin domain-containing protein n=1 Tax=Oculimacula yallundae TaxID=86028 RepID=A0ABR4BWP7_9HELO
MGYTTEGNGPALLTTCVVCLVLTWIFFAVRIYTRAFLTQVWKIEDWLFVASQLSFTVYAVISLESTLHGNGQHNKDIALSDIPIAMRYFFWGEILYVITAFVMRLSIGFFILRIMTQRSFIWTIRMTMALITLATVMDLFYTIFQCKPISYFWLQFSGIPGKCLPAPQVQAISIAYSAASATADILFGVMPICVLWNLQMNRKAKIIVGVLLCVGIVAGLTVIVRIKYIIDVSLTEDFMFATANVSIWALIEPAIAICCMAASTWRPLFNSLREKTSMPSGYGVRAGTGNGYFNNGSKGHSHQNNTFGLSRNHSGYTKRMDDEETSSYDDVVLQSLAEGPGTGRRISDGDDDTKGILRSTIVQITRHDRTGNQQT